jgi:hypothetical protein
MSVVKLSTSKILIKNVNRCEINVGMAGEEITTAIVH